MSLPGLLDATFHEGLRNDTEKNPDIANIGTDDFFFKNFGYEKTPDAGLVRVTGFPREIDVGTGGPYANYNWELFFHIPLTIAVHLSRNQRFAEAQRWFHYIFKPTSNDVGEPKSRVWKFLAFRQSVSARRIEDIVAILSTPRTELSPEQQTLQDQIWEDYTSSLNKPGQPSVVARTRLMSQQFFVLMKYLDNLITWGEHLHQQDTVESINEATQVYVLAANILGERPQRIPPRGTVNSRTFADLRTEGLGPIGNAFIDLESQFPFNSMTSDSGTSAGTTASSALFGIGRTLYFCVPPNEKLLRYWDIVADRLFKIRHCMNIAGVVRPLALFDPPIDPAMLAKAAAAGIDIGSIVSGLNRPVGPVRSLSLIQRSIELASEVRSLGSALLAAIEKGDAEHLALVRQEHEVNIQRWQQEVRFLQWKQAQESTESLLRSRACALERYRYYQRLLDESPRGAKPPELDRTELFEATFDAAYESLVVQYARQIDAKDFTRLNLASDFSLSGISELISAGKLYLSVNEFVALDVLPLISAGLKLGAAAGDVITSALAQVPHAYVKVSPYGVGTEVELPLGQSFSNTGEATTRSLQGLANVADTAASLVAQTASYERRADEWILQERLAACDLMLVGRQIIGSLIAEQVAYREYSNVQIQIQQSQDIENQLLEKSSNEGLYLWMQGEITRLYYEYYRFAVDTARRAERTMKQELMRPELDSQEFVKFNYWDSGRKGLLSGEALYLDLKRLEMAYHENNKREFELTKHVSVRQLNPVALLTLKATGMCQVTIPEWLYDLDCPGHYMRRIQSMALSTPAISGPFISVNCTLSLLKSTVRKSAHGEYKREGPEDERFIDYIGAVESIVTSTGQNDSGMFEPNLRDERFLPFEGAGAASTWKLDLPKDHQAFDYTTISDVILHIRYTARQGVAPDGVKKALDDLLQEANQSNLALLFSLRHDFPTEWAAFVTGGDEFSATIRKDYFPYFTQGRTVTVTGLDLYDGTDVSNHHPIDVPAAANERLNTNKAFAVTISPDAPGPMQVLTASAQVFLIARYTVDTGS
jgi:hypothetical protein